MACKIIPVYFQSPTAYIQYAIDGWKKVNTPENMDRFGYAYRTMYGRKDSVDMLSLKFRDRDFGNWTSSMAAAVGDIATDTLTEKKFMFASRLTEGDLPDVGRFLDGQERMWCGCRRRDRKRRTVRIYINFVGASSAGRLAVALAEGLESAGIGTEIHAVAGTSVEVWPVGGSSLAGKRRVILVEIVRLKSLDEYADFGAIGFACGNWSFFGDLEFSTEVTALMNAGYNMSSIGSVHDVSVRDLGLDEDEARTALVIPCGSTDGWAKAELERLLRQNEGGEDTDYGDFCECE